MPNILIILIACSTLLSFIFFIATVAALRKKKLFSSAFRFLLALLAVSLAGLMGMIVIATAGYRALTHEEVAAVVKIEPIGAKQFTAHFRFPDGQESFIRVDRRCSIRRCPHSQMEAPCQYIGLTYGLRARSCRRPLFGPQRRTGKYPHGLSPFPG